MNNKLRLEYQLISKNDQRPFLVDVTAPAKSTKTPVILFTHGFKGFKDWGHFHILANKFCEAGFAFFKYNVSHNGTTVDDPMNFGDLDAFGNNNFTKELLDVELMIEHITNNGIEGINVDINNLFLIGHSRGGGVSLIKAQEDERVKAVVTWAALGKFGMNLTNDLVAEWKKNGVFYIDNARTNQKMPMYLQGYKDLIENKERLDPARAAKEMTKPTLLIHGDGDETVPVEQAFELKEINSKIELEIIAGANHVFGGSHPFVSEKLHPHTLLMLEKSISFLKNQLN